MYLSLIAEQEVVRFQVNCEATPLL